MLLLSFANDKDFINIYSTEAKGYKVKNFEA